MNADTDLRSAITREFAFDRPLASGRRRAGNLLNRLGLLRRIDRSNPEPRLPPTAGADVFCRSSARRSAIPVLDYRDAFSRKAGNSNG
jgi:hypothetical protein